jgi:hypothetical protein
VVATKGEQYRYGAPGGSWTRHLLSHAAFVVSLRLLGQCVV